ncbi:MAG TPA: sodium:solute symporter [Phycisphaerae bacterium]|nr:sodium/solute symporter [Phycisphaerae bacterium]HOB74830.1 sodium:solute symporter [Phycisphaerae bacterium]HOJ54335.1 sodium:solute symporter [Phycisphaerae bacterium]HOL26806.1 sodium:solute symporter [Phycisphaerae bacterium]HPP19967.1 sodium:solute symporter [Phycisphaerae bacterium]
MHALDWIVIALYFTILLGVAWWVILKSKNTADDYFLAGRHLGWFIVGASIFASNIGSEHLVGLAGAGATSGVAMAHYELHAWCVLVLGWVFVPFYARSKVFTTPEFLEKRFSASSRWLLSLISLVAYVLTKMAVGIFAGGVVFSTLLPELSWKIGGFELDSFWIGSILVVLATGAYTILGGLRTVAYTEAIQTFIFIFGSAAVTWFGLKAVGGWGELRSICGSDMFNLWKPLVPAGVQGTWSPVEVVEAGKVVKQAWYFNDNFPWLGMLFCAPIVGLWYWCTDQYIVQRALGAPNETQARRGAIFAGMLKLLPVFIFIVPGMIAFALAATGKSEFLRQHMFENGQVSNEKAQAAFPLLVQAILPPGVRGLVVAGLLAALMSSLAGAFNASSTLFTIDFYGKLRPRASQHELVWMGRIATAVLVLIALVWIPVVRGQQGLYIYLQGVQSYLAPPIFAVFFLGVFMKRLNAAGCLSALVVGFLLGAFRLAVDTPVLLKPQWFPGYEPGSFLWIINKTFFQYYSLVIFLVSALVMIGVSYATPAPDPERLRGLTYATVSERERLESRLSYDWRDIAGTALVLGVILAGYLYFNG